MGDAMNLYFDNSSTSFPKPKEVIHSINDFITNIGASPSRGQYSLSIKSNRILFNCRYELCNLLNYNKPENIVLTYNATYAFNILLQSLLNSSLFKDRPDVLISKLDHNSTYRPLINLENKGIISLKTIKCTNNHLIDIEDIIDKITPKTKFLILSHMSNVIGNICDIKKISDICKDNGIFLIIDASQSIGICNIDLTNMYFSALIFTGHKNLFSSQGIGGFLIHDDLLKYSDNYFLGGTGSSSSSLVDKTSMPDYFEVGTTNMVGVASLLSGINFVKSLGINYIYEKKKYLLTYIYDKLSNIKDLILVNNSLLPNQNSNLCINFKNMPPNYAAYILDKEFNICVRSGLHCAPYTHMEIGTFPQGCIRISPSIFHDNKEANFLIDAIYKMTKMDNVPRET